MATKKIKTTIDFSTNVMWKNEILPIKVFPYLSVRDLTKVRRTCKLFLGVVKNTVVLDKEESNIWSGKKERRFPSFSDYLFNEVVLDFRNVMGDKIFQDFIKYRERQSLCLKILKIRFKKEINLVFTIAVNTIFDSSFKLDKVFLYFHPRSTSTSLMLIKDIILNQKRLKCLYIKNYNEKENTFGKLFSKIELGDLTFDNLRCIVNVDTLKINSLAVVSTNLGANGWSDLFSSIIKNDYIKNSLEIDNTNISFNPGFILKKKLKLYKFSKIPKHFYDEKYVMEEENIYSFEFKFKTLSYLTLRNLYVVLLSRNFNSIKVSFVRVVVENLGTQRKNTTYINFLKTLREMKDLGKNFQFNYRKACKEIEKIWKRNVLSEVKLLFINQEENVIDDYHLCFDDEPKFIKGYELSRYLIGKDVITSFEQTIDEYIKLVMK